MSVKTYNMKSLIRENPDDPKSGLIDLDETHRRSNIIASQGSNDEKDWQFMLNMMLMETHTRFRHLLTYQRARQEYDRLMDAISSHKPNSGDKDTGWDLDFNIDTIGREIQTRLTLKAGKDDVDFIEKHGYDLFKKVLNKASVINIDKKSITRNKTSEGEEYLYVCLVDEIPDDVTCDETFDMIHNEFHSYDMISGDPGNRTPSDDEEYWKDVDDQMIKIKDLMESDDDHSPLESNRSIKMNHLDADIAGKILLGYLEKFKKNTGDEDPLGKYLLNVLCEKMKDVSPEGEDKFIELDEEDANSLIHHLRPYINDPLCQGDAFKRIPSVSDIIERLESACEEEYDADEFVHSPC